jgi:hypothetical protein
MVAALGQIIVILGLRRMLLPVQVGLTAPGFNLLAAPQILPQLGEL